MFLNSWSISLCLLSLIVLLLTLMAAKTAVKVVRFWDLSSDSNMQIRLENETWLASTLIQYALGFQIISLLLYVLAADQFSQVIAGAMCATGSFTANSYGLPALLVKIVGVFLYGFWIIVHQFDISSEKYPLLKFKYVFLLSIIPLLLLDIYLQVFYIAKLEPDIITSCCAVVFGDSGQSSSNLFSIGSQSQVLSIFYGTAVLLAAVNIFQYKADFLIVRHITAFLWALFFVISLVAVTMVFSSYVYAMPYHKCPFCIIKGEYNYIGIFQYLALIVCCFFGGSVSPLSLVVKNPDLQEQFKRYRQYSILISTVFMGIFVALSSYHLVVYRFFGGES